MPSQWFPDPSESATPQNRDTRISHNANARTLSQPKIDFRNDCLNLNDFQRAAKKTLSKELYEYVSSGTGDEQTLQENQLAFQRYFLRPRVMRSVGKVSTGTTLLGHNVSMPVFISPAGLHALCESEHGECATARAAAKAGILLGVSQHSTRSIEEVAAAVPSGSLQFYQAYILKDRSRTMELIRRALRAGYQGIFVTVDSVRFGYREADARNNFNALPPPHRLVNYDDPSQERRLDEIYNSGQAKAWDQNSEQMFDQNVTWDDIAAIKREIGQSVPLVVKGIMTAEDAELALRAGADVIVVSNHGGRQLDGALASIDALPEVVQVVAGRVPVWMDSGVRRGTDVLKALALGASAVGIGKPFFYALAVGGEEGVSFLLELLRTEVEAAMAICGIQAVSEVSRDLVTERRSRPGTMFVDTPVVERLSKL